MVRDNETGDREDGFLARWHRRKRDAQRGETDPETEGEEQATTELAPPEEQAPALTDADMPPVDSLGEHSDVSGFFSEGVSEELRQRALRRLFRGAKFNIRDGLDDYDEDYRAMMTPLGDTVTHDLRRQRKRQQEREEARQAAARRESEESEALSEDAHLGEHADAASTDSETPARPDADDATTDGGSDGRPA